MLQQPYRLCVEVATASSKYIANDAKTWGWIPLSLSLFLNRTWHIMNCTSLHSESQTHKIMELTKLEKTCKTTESNLQPNTTLTTRPWHYMPHPGFLKHLQGQWLHHLPGIRSFATGKKSEITIKKLKYIVSTYCRKNTYTEPWIRTNTFKYWKWQA